jgi:malate dehydrogenase (oxaloacetate-decarboxylating)(NADP+)
MASIPLQWQGPATKPGKVSRANFLRETKRQDLTFDSNVYVFPGIGLGAILSKAIHVSQEMIYASAVALSNATNATEINDGKLYPDMDRIREVSVIVCREVIKQAQAQGLDREISIRGMNNANLDEYIRGRMYDPFKETGVARSAKKLPDAGSSPVNKSVL